MERGNKIMIKKVIKILVKITGMAAGLLFVLLVVVGMAFIAMLWT